MGAIVSQITSLTIVYSTVYSDADQRKHQSSASLAFVRGIHRRPVNSPHKWPVTRKIFPFDDVIMTLHDPMEPTFNSRKRNPCPHSHERIKNRPPWMIYKIWMPYFDSLLRDTDIIMFNYQTKLSTIILMNIYFHISIHFGTISMNMSRNSICQTMMTSSNGNIFRVAGPLCGKFIARRWIPHTKASEAELWCFLWSAPE